MAADRQNYRDEIAGEIIARIEAGTAPWQKPWQAGSLGAAPFNPVSGKPYRGINDIWLTLQGHSDPRWMTYNQALAAGAQVRKGEKSTTIEYWQWTERQVVKDSDGKPVLDADGKERQQTVKLSRPRVFFAKVFNGGQIDGLEPYVPQALAFDPHERAEALIAGAGVKIHHDQRDRAFYSPASDDIHLPAQGSFKSQAAYYETVLHELGHATGQKSRLNRAFGPFGSEGYAREELRAEIASYMLARDMGVSFDPSNHAAYVESWLKVLREDNNEIFRAARDAEIIKTWVMEPEKRLELERGAAHSVSAQQSLAPVPQETAPPVERAEKMEVRPIDRLENYFRPGRIVPSYGGQDEVVAFRREGAIGWQVEVRAVESGSPGPLRTHYTMPSEKLLADWEKDHPVPPRPRVYLDVPFDEKNAAKSAGAKWDRDAKAWFVPADLDPSSFQRWAKASIPRHLEADIEAVKQALTDEARLEAKTEVVMSIADLPPERQRSALQATAEIGITAKDIAAYQKHVEAEAKADLETDKAISKLYGPDNWPEQAAGKGGAMESARLYIAVPFAEKNEAKTLGARWDKNEKAWYIPEGQDHAPFAKWTAAKSAPDLTPEQEFAEALKANGLVLDRSPEMDGKWHRVPVDGDKGNDMSGAYRGFLDGRPSGLITNYKAGVQALKWVSMGTALTEEARAQIQADAANVRAAREAAQREAAEKAAKVAYGIWTNLPGAATAENAVYLAAKGVGGHGVKVNDEGKMVVPARDAAGRLWTLQFVDDGSKLFLKDSHKAGTMHVVEPTGKGTLDALEKHPGPVLVAEGYATAARIFEATQRPVVMAFDSGNLKAVVEAVHERFPDRSLLICADNDHANRLGNIGMKKAEEAAVTVGATFIAPKFTADEMAKGLTDFDDLGRARGNGAVRQVIEGALSRHQEMERSIA